MRAPLAVVALFVACAPARPSTTAPLATPAPTPCVEPADVGDLTGSWMSGTGDAPAVQEIVLHTECAHHPAVWLLEQKGDEVRAWDFPARMDQGIAQKEPVARIAPDTARVCGRELVFRDGFRVRFDAESAQLRGTRDGKPFWAVRQRAIGPGPCPGIP